MVALTGFRLGIVRFLGSRADSRGWCVIDFLYFPLSFGLWGLGLPLYLGSLGGRYGCLSGGFWGTCFLSL